MPTRPPRFAAPFLLLFLSIFTPGLGAQEAAANADERDWEAASALFARGLYWEAEARFAALAGRRPRHARIRFGLGAALARSERPRAALEALDLALELGLRDPQCHLLRAGVLETLGRPAEAEAAYLAGIALDPDHPELRLRLGILLHRRGERGRAARELDRALELRPAHPETLYERASLAFREGDVALARRHALAATRADPSLPSARYLLSRLAARARDHEEAREHARIFDELRRRQEEDALARRTALARVGLGYRALRARDLETAVRCFAAALDARPGDEQARAGLESLRRGLAADAPLRRRIEARLAEDAKMTAKETR